ncbi:MAG: type III pantothenate kinase [Chloroflexi bacterium]|nr:MAG: type III pantothenate kinase [Chloroflexota bacterium]
MLLAINIGNTNITLGVWNGRSWQQQWRLRTVHEKTTDEYGVTLKALLRRDHLDNQIDACIMSSVVPVLTATFSRVCEIYLQQPVLHVGPHLDLGITVETDNPSEVGTDRIVNAAASYHLFPGPSITIDMGTATTFDVVTRDGRFLGGVIAPGLGVAADALTSRAAQLRSVPLEPPPSAIGRNTVHAMQSGLLFGYVALIEGIVQRLKAEHPDNNQSIRVIGTGGLISLITAHTHIIDEVDPWLTLTGLRLIYERVHS